MPKSKRNRVYTLSQTRKKGREAKSGLLQEIRDCVDKYSHIFVYSVQNMRNSKLKEVRSQWKSSRWFYGRNRVLATALGKSETEEYRDGLSSLAEGDVISWFQSYSEQDHARSGFLATDDVVIQEGPVDKFPHSMEPHLRSLGLPSLLKKGVVCLTQEYTVCREGDILTPEQARLLKLLDWKMAEFKISLQAVWTQDGTLQLLANQPEDKDTREEEQSPLLP